LIWVEAPDHKYITKKIMFQQNKVGFNDESYSRAEGNGSYKQKYSYFCFVLNSFVRNV